MTALYTSAREAAADAAPGGYKNRAPLPTGRTVTPLLHRYFPMTEDANEAYHEAYINHAGNIFRLYANKVNRRWGVAITRMRTIAERRELEAKGFMGGFEYATIARLELPYRKGSGKKPAPTNQRADAFAALNDLFRRCRAAGCFETGEPLASTLPAQENVNHAQNA
jgi:hypothetical protein